MTVVLPFLRQRGDIMKESRNEELKPRSVVLPAYIWETLEEDAKRCRRSVTKQIEALLVRYYKLEAGIELDEEALDSTFHAVSHKRLKKAG